RGTSACSDIAFELSLTIESSVLQAPMSRAMAPNGRTTALAPEPGNAAPATARLRRAPRVRLREKRASAYPGVSTWARSFVAMPTPNEREAQAPDGARLNLDRLEAISTRTRA